MTHSRKIKNLQKYIFIDRDGTIVKDAGYLHKIKDIEFIPKAISGLKKLQSMGYQFIIVTNQAGIARNYYSLKDAEKFNNELIRRLKTKGIEIKKIYLCPHHPRFTGQCQCRKPKIGLVEMAIKEFNIDLTESIFIGDKDCDVQLGRNCKGTTFLVKNDQYRTRIRPDFIIKNLEEVSAILKTN